jgi:hypothetical protein
MVAVRHSTHVGLVLALHSKTGQKISPKVKCRIPATNNGGNDSSPMRTARNVEPQTKYTAANAARVRVGLGDVPRESCATSLGTAGLGTSVDWVSEVGIGDRAGVTERRRF